MYNAARDTSRPSAAFPFFFPDKRFSNFHRCDSYWYEKAPDVPAATIHIYKAGQQDAFNGAVPPYYYYANFPLGQLGALSGAHAGRFIF